MFEKKPKKMFTIILRNVNLIIIVLFTTFIASFFVIEFTLDYRNIHRNLILDNQNNHVIVEEIINNIQNYNEMIVNSFEANLLDNEIIDNLIRNNPFISNIIINDDYKVYYNMLDFNQDIFNLMTEVTEKNQYYFLVTDNHLYLIYKYDNYFISYDIDKNNILDIINQTNSNNDFIMQTSTGEVLLTNIDDLLKYNIDNLKTSYRELVVSSNLSLFGETYFLYNLIKTKTIAKQLFLNSYLTFIVSGVMLVISLFIIKRNLYYLTNKPYEVLMHDMEMLLDINYKSLMNLENQQIYAEYKNILNEFKKICLYNENQLKKLIVENERQLHLALESNKTKSLFLANMSHEMRTPLNAIITYIGLCKNIGFNDIDKIKEYFERINTSSEILLQKINDILDLSKIEANQFELFPKSANLRSLVKEIYDILNVQALRKNLEFTYYIDPHIPKYLEIDASRLKQVLINLCNNSIKFTEKGTVKLEIELFGYTNDSIVLDYRISDTGCGIPKDKIDKIFLPFVQIDNNNSRQVGTGLGLTISQDIIRLMGGEIRVTSKENEGSIFTFTTIFKMSETDNNEKVNNEISNEYFEKVIKNKKILVAEDNVINQIVLKELFSVFKKNDIDFASDGLEAVNMVKNKKYDIILMDIQMPKMSGIEATINIRKLPRENIPIIALSANAFAEQINEYLQSGMTDFLPKPIDIGKLKNMIIKYLDI